MHNSLIILLNRPFVSDGHLQSACSAAASNAFTHCAHAAIDIDKILRLYQKHFCMMTTPYFISYATYVSATIHVRIAAQRQADSADHQRLQTCLDALAQHQVSCHAPRQTMRILKSLISRLGVKVRSIPEPTHFDCSSVSYLGTIAGREPSTGVTGFLNSLTTQTFLPEANQEDLDSSFLDLDIEEIMRSFEMAPKGLLPPLNAEERLDIQTTPLALGLNATELGSHLDIMPGLGGGDNPSLLDSDSQMFLDPLFGF